jgi:hypothetical protein
MRLPDSRAREIGVGIVQDRPQEGLVIDHRPTLQDATRTNATFTSHGAGAVEHRQALSPRSGAASYSAILPLPKE